MCDNKVIPDMTGARPDSKISLVRFDPAKEMEVLRVRKCDLIITMPGCITRPV